MIHNSYCRSFYPVLFFFLFSLLIPCVDTQAANGQAADIAGQVAALNIGMQGYRIGTRLTADQKNAAAANLADDAYQGTYKFRDGELFIVVAEKDDTVLALYQRSEDADFALARKMISGLMGLFGEPTAMAHDKLIYWAYSTEGKISEENYNAAKEQSEQMKILATVKFSSEFAMTTDEGGDGQERGTLYFIISSDRMTEDFMKND